jgi:hypothetical protein
VATFPQPTSVRSILEVVTKYGDLVKNPTTPQFAGLNDMLKGAVSNYVTAASEDQAKVVLIISTGTHPMPGAIAQSNQTQQPWQSICIDITGMKTRPYETPGASKISEMKLTRNSREWLCYFWHPKMTADDTTGVYAMLKEHVRQAPIRRFS